MLVEVVEGLTPRVKLGVGVEVGDPDSVLVDEVEGLTP